MRFWNDGMIGIGIFDLIYKAQMLNRSRAVTWLTIVEQPILKCIECTV